MPKVYSDIITKLTDTNPELVYSLMRAMFGNLDGLPEDAFSDTARLAERMGPRRTKEFCVSQGFSQ